MSKIDVEMPKSAGYRFEVTPWPGALAITGHADSHSLASRRRTCSTSSASAGARLPVEEETRYATLGPQRIPMYRHPVPSSSSEKITGV
ncbi:hypothetical protein [Streptomyces iakyrus]